MSFGTMVCSRDASLLRTCSIVPHFILSLTLCTQKLPNASPAFQLSYCQKAGDRQECSPNSTVSAVRQLPFWSYLARHRHVDQGTTWNKGVLRLDLRKDITDHTGLTSAAWHLSHKAQLHVSASSASSPALLHAWKLASAAGVFL